MKAKRKIKVILADRDGFYLQRLKRCLERKGEMQVLGMTDSGPALMEMAKDLHPDVILMDILLGERDGFWVLESLKKEGMDCVCIMISAIDSDKLVRQAISLGADYYMAKPIQGELLLERMYQLLEQEMEQKRITEEKEEAVTTVFRDLEGEISVLLSRMGISAGIKGYHFIRKAVIMAAEDEEVLVGITKGLYPDIAKMYKTSA
ncbi:MAG: response regulator, partial [Anaerotignum sp.]|nr:response regulator [Anaerotignum sp.]